jgi:hypothetical protein
VVSLWDDLAQVEAGLLDQLDGLDVAHAELSKVLLGSVVYGYLQRACADPHHPAFVPGPGYHLHVGTPNPDTVYLTAAVEGSGTYRLRGIRGTVPEVSLMPMGAPTAAGVTTYAAFDLDDLELDDQGGFDVVVSSSRSAGHAGDWWEITPDVSSLMLRSVSDEWGTHREPLVAITRLDGAARRARPDAEQVAARVRSVGAVAGASVGYGLRKVASLRAAGAVNDVVLVDYAANGGLAGQWYHEGVYDLREAEALVVEAAVGRSPSYLSLSLTDGLFCTLDWANAQTSLNRSQAVIDDDGVLRAVVAAEDPGVANWLDTTGHLVGVLQLRWTGLAEPPAVTVTGALRSDVRRHLPPGTPVLGAGERAQRLRERASSAQLRQLW